MQRPPHPEFRGAEREGRGVGGALGAELGAEFQGAELWGRGCCFPRGASVSPAPRGCDKRTLWLFSWEEATTWAQARAREGLCRPAWRLGLERGARPGCVLGPRRPRPTAGRPRVRPRSTEAGRGSSFPVCSAALSGVSAVPDPAD